MIKTIEITKIKKNPKNPRVIKDFRFEKLVKSIQDFPEMLRIRPIVINSENMILGGNQRLEAAKKAGLKEIPVYYAEELDDEQQKEFIIKDNVHSGDWDWDVLIDENLWDKEILEEWGVENFPTFNQDLDSFIVDPVEDEPLKNPTASDEGYSLFELVMLHENKIEMIRIINAVRAKYSIDKIEDALMKIVKEYTI